MSGYLVARSFYVRGLHIRLKYTLTVLCDRASNEGYCYASQERIAEETEVSVRQVRRNLEELEHLGLIRRRHAYDERGKRTADDYFIDVERLPLPPGPRFTHEEKPKDEKLSTDYRTPMSGSKPSLPDIHGRLPDIRGGTTGHPDVRPTLKQSSTKDARAREDEEVIKKEAIRKKPRAGKPKHLCRHGNCPHPATVFDGRGMSSNRRGWCSEHSPHHRAGGDMDPETRAQGLLKIREVMAGVRRLHRGSGAGVRRRGSGPGSGEGQAEQAMVATG